MLYTEIQLMIIQIVFPLSKAIVAVIALYVAVSYWNSYFYPMIFINDKDKLQRSFHGFPP